MDYHEFRREYEDQHPASVPRLEIIMHEYPGWVRWAVLVTFVCAAMVSGVHTIPTVWKGIEVGPIITEAVRNAVSVASLAAVELAILLSAYLMAKGIRLAYVIMAVASLVAVGANLYSVITAFKSGSDTGALAVAVVLGIAVPLIALFTGKMFVDIHRADRVQDSQSRKVFKEASVGWDKEIEKAWRAYQKPGKSQLHESSREVHETSQPPKPRVKLHEVAREIHENGDKNLTVAEMMEKYSISQGSTTKVREILKNSNGHGVKGPGDVQ